MFSRSAIAIPKHISVVVPNSGKILITAPRAHVNASFRGVIPCFRA
jgi:hypothetical protein